MFGRNLAGLGAQPLASKDLNLIINGDFNYNPAQKYVRVTKVAGEVGLTALSDTTPTFTPCARWSPAPPFRCGNHGIPVDSAATYDTFIEDDEINKLKWLTCKTIVGNSDALGAVRIRPFYYFIEDQDVFDLVSRADNTITLSFKFKASHAGQYSLGMGKTDDKQFTIYSWQYTTPNKIQEVSFTITVPRDSLLNSTPGIGLRFYWCYGMNADDSTGATPCYLSDDTNLNGNWSPVAKPMLTRTSDFKWWQTTNASIAITGVQVVAGQEKVPMAPRSLDETAFLCRRYGIYAEGPFAVVNYDRSSVSATFVIDNYIPRVHPNIHVSSYGHLEVLSESNSLAVSIIAVDNSSKAYSGQRMFTVTTAVGRVGVSGTLKTKLSDGSQWIFFDSLLG